MKSIYHGPREIMNSVGRLAVAIGLSLILFPGAATMQKQRPNQLSPEIRGGKWGYHDPSGKFAIAPQYDWADYFSEGLAAVAVGSRWGFIDEAGRMVIAPQFEMAWRFSEGLAAVIVGRKLGYINRSGQIVIAPQFDVPLVFFQTRLGPHGFDYPSPAEFKGMIERGEYFDPRSNLGLANYFRFEEGLAMVRLGDKLGFIDRSGRVVIAPGFEAAEPFSEGVAAVKIGGGWGYIDREGRPVVPPQFDGAGSFREGWGSVVLGDKSFYVNRDGERREWPPRPGIDTTPGTPYADLFDGFGNGSLHIHLVRDLREWGGEEGEDAFYLGLDFHRDDWEAVFVDELHVPDWDHYKEGDDINELQERNRAKFQRAIPAYPLLGRIFDMYESYEYMPEEVKELREECTRLTVSISNLRAERALRKLIYACDEALRRGFSLFFSCD